METKIIRSWNGRTIRQREDGYLCLTDMAQACGKRVDNWTRLDSTEEYLKALQQRRYSDLRNENLIEVIQGGTPELQGTWAYRKVALRFAQWLSPDFAVQVDEWVEELLLKRLVRLQPAKHLSAIDRIDKVNALHQAVLHFDFVISNPRFKQEVQDLIGDALGLSKSKALPSADQELWMGVAERAEELGYPVQLVTRFRSALGRFVKSSGLTSREEKRLCNGTERSINLYLVSEKLDFAVKEYMDAKVLANPVD